eukprot:CAMPEP_0185194034 /NCGR_PEP_ID=MMETSP1140-20130426/28897_1 /TAXON_ID=298111 /ORGANISM="Pavlova sp., Strain CCMP459" /LENGTH=105 /DNA_ID=CAMNT_0027760921 /DNA_START=377 /DNA_END=694 /DNA_ORIENTATION=+
MIAGCGVTRLDVFVWFMAFVEISRMKSLMTTPCSDVRRSVNRVAKLSSPGTLLALSWTSMSMMITADVAAVAMRRLRAPPMFHAISFVIRKMRMHRAVGTHVLRR